MGGNAGGNPGSTGVIGGNNNKEEEDGDFGRFLMSMLDEAPIATNNAVAGIGGHPLHAHPGAAALPGPAAKKAAARSSYCDPNFRYAAPFLAGITSYMERNGVPFEHIDIWVPTTIPPALEGEGRGSMGSAPMMGEMGSGGSQTSLVKMDVYGGGEKGGDSRLCFAGSATLSVQIVDEPSSAAVDPSGNNDGEKKNNDASTKKIAPLSGDEIFNFSLFGDYSEKFSFSSGCGLPGRVFKSGVAAWEQFLTNAPPEMFERRGGAIQFGVKTALGLPIESPNVGRVVVVMYSKHNREKDEGLVGRVVKDVRLFSPCPRWKLVVDVRGASASPVEARPPAPSSVSMASSSSFNAGMSALSMQPPTTPLGMDLFGESTTRKTLPQIPTNDSKNNQIISLISLLQENMPSDQFSALGKQLNSIMSLRMILLRPNRSPEEEQLVETILVLYESYVAAGRTRPDITFLVTRDYDFHRQHQQRMAMLAEPSPITATQAQQHPQPQLMMQHNYNTQGPLGPPMTAPVGSFLPAPLVPPQQPFAGGVAGGQLSVLQNVVHPFPSSGRLGDCGMPPMQIQTQQSMLLNTHPSNGSMPQIQQPPIPSNKASNS